jgi:hypothetical protein
MRVGEPKLIQFVLGSFDREPGRAPMDSPLISTPRLHSRPAAIDPYAQIATMLRSYNEEFGDSILARCLARLISVDLDIVSSVECSGGPH